MASRSAASALSCFQCRATVLKAFASASAPRALRTPASASPVAFSRVAHSSQLPTGRSFATAQTEEEESQAATPKEPEDEWAEEFEIAEATAGENANGDDTPWYLQVEPPRHAPTQHVAKLPEVPEESPAILEPLMKFVYEEMGLDDLSLLDLREMEPPPALGQNLMMLFGTARSERHLHISSGRLVKWLRNEHRIESKADGLIGPGELKTKLRRLRKKQKLLGSNAMPTGGDDGITTGWICVNLGTIDKTISEAQSYDTDGKISGFGAPITGTTVIVQVMTDSRRKELDLEKLWSGQLKRSTQSEEALRGDSAEADFYGKFGMDVPKPKNPMKNRTVDFEHIKKAPAKNRRHFSTSARRLTDVGAKLAKSSPLDEIRMALEEIRASGDAITLEQCTAILKDIFSQPPPSAAAATSGEQTPATAAATTTTTPVSLATMLFTLMHERRLPILDNEILVTMLETIILSQPSGSRDPSLAEIQSNLEHLLVRSSLPCPGNQQLARLLSAYLSQRNMDRFWDVWAMPARHQRHRSPILYRVALEAAAATESPTICANVLRTLVAQIGEEAPPIPLTDAIWVPFKNCIAIVQPNAENLATTFQPPYETRKRRSRTHVNDDDRPLFGEFVKMYRLLNRARQAGT